MIIFLLQVLVPNLLMVQPLESTGLEVQLGPITAQDNVIQSRFNYFDLELLRTFGNDGNYLISPASIKATLGMILEGAKGKSAEEISDLLRIPVDQNGIREKLQRLLYDLTDKSGTTVLNSANALFISNKLNISPVYHETLTKTYNAIVRPLNFSNIVESTYVINNWVFQATQKKISQLVEPGSVDPSVSAVIANALYFKGNWKNCFSINETYEHKCFKVKDGCHSIQMMHNVDTYKYKFIEELDSSAVELPYSDDKYAMLILLPQEKITVDGLIRDLQHVSFSSIVNSLETTEVLIEIPKFEIEFSVDMVPSLNLLGISTVFGPNSDLSGITSTSGVKIDSIIHKTKISVNEEGTEAAAVSGAVVVPLMGTTIPEIIANRPFLFFIYQVDSRNIIFEGRFNRPPS